MHCEVSELPYIYVEANTTLQHLLEQTTHHSQVLRV